MSDSGVSAECACLFIFICSGPFMVLAGLGCLIAALSTSHWVEKTYGGEVYVHGGLFEVCFPKQNDTCIDWDDSVLVDSTVSVKLSIAALIIACIGYLLGFIVMAVFVYKILTNENPSWKGHSSWATAWIMNCTGLGMFVRFKTEPSTLLRQSILDSYDEGYSYDLCWIALVLVAVGTIVTCCVALCATDGDIASGAAPVPLGNTSIRESVYTVQTPDEPAPSESVSDTSGTETAKAP